jgi:hypothetical protein
MRRLLTTTGRTLGVVALGAFWWALALFGSAAAFGGVMWLWLSGWPG